MEQKKTFIFTAAALLILLATFTGAFYGTQALGQSSSNSTSRDNINTLMVTGNGEAGVKLDRVKIQVGVLTEGLRPIESSSESRQLITVCTGGIVTVNFITQEIRIDDRDGTMIPRKQWQEPLMLELRSFMECVEKGERPLVRGEDGVNTTKIAEAALISSQTGSPIHLQL